MELFVYRVLYLSIYLSICLSPCIHPEQMTLEHPEVAQTCGVLSIFTTPCTFSVSQLPKVLETRCVFHMFDFQMCFALQLRAPVPHLNVQKCSETGVSLAFWPPTINCNFYQSFISHLPRWLRATLGSLLFDPLEPQNFGKTQCFGIFLPLRAPWSSFFLLSLLWLFPPLLFHRSILSAVWLLNFLR